MNYTEGLLYMEGGNATAIDFCHVFHDKLG